jgi:hypothetical protein
LSKRRKRNTCPVGRGFPSTEPPNHDIRFSYHTRYDPAYLDGGAAEKPLPLEVDVSQYRSLQDLVDTVLAKIFHMLEERYNDPVWVRQPPKVQNVYVSGQYGWMQINWLGEQGRDMCRFCPAKHHRVGEWFHKSNTGGVRVNFAQRNIVYICWDDVCGAQTGRSSWMHPYCVVCRTLPDVLAIANQHCGRSTVKAKICEPRWFADDKGTQGKCK